ncbi:uncharacterized protein LOC128954636 [Oppia nitens]|uniref:uncharacterized protein LOC128954636 n=1 Tax=Oppia nitens TaxID=1686743 RepID=UPI0023DA2D21|nr:uncharacterized protein LOC128954636 [Oppia nitens]
MIDKNLMISFILCAIVLYLCSRIANWLSVLYVNRPRIGYKPNVGNIATGADDHESDYETDDETDEETDKETDESDGPEVNAPVPITRKRWAKGEQRIVRFLVKYLKGSANTDYQYMKNFMDKCEYERSVSAIKTFRYKKL